MLAGAGGVVAGFVAGNLTVHQSSVAGTAAVVTALSAGVDARHELFVGRDAQIEQLLDALALTSEGAAPVVVAGMGGIGKTALACRAAAIAAERGWFPGGVLFVDLRGYDLGDDVQPLQVFAPALRVLGVAGDEVPGTPDEQATVYHQVLDQLGAQQQRVLLVLDNAAAGSQVADLLPRHVVHRAVVTSRDFLVLPYAHRLDLDVLSADEAAQLLSDFLDHRYPGDLRAAREPRAAAELVAVCGAVPLAVVITASILADDLGLPIAELVEELTAADGPGVHRVAYGDQVVDACIEFSRQRLATREPEAAALLPLLSLNPGPDFASATAAVLAGRPVAQVRPDLRTLRRASLLRQDGGRWFLHDLVRLHARDHLDPESRDTALRRMLEHYRVIATAANRHLQAVPERPLPEEFPGRAEALDWFDAERANLVATVALALTTDHFETCVLLSGTLVRYLERRHHLVDWEIVARCGVAAAERLGIPAATGAALNSLGTAMQSGRRFDAAIPVLRRAADIFRELGDRRREGAVLSNLGLVLRELRLFGDAIAAHESGLAICREAGDDPGAASAVNNLGLALRAARRFDEAAAAHEEAVAINRALGFRRGEGQALSNLGLVLAARGRFDEAIEAHQQASSLSRQARESSIEAQALTNLGDVYRQLGQFDDALAAQRDAALLYRQVGDLHREARALGNLALSLRAVGRFDEALSVQHQAIALCGKVGDSDYQGRLLGDLGTTLLQAGRFYEAEAVLRASSAFSRLDGDARTEGSVLYYLGLALENLHRVDDAKATGRKALAALSECADRELEKTVRDWLNGLP
ncbi:tetratricopeptide repeat protein [Amycolatopsis sp. NBC_00355]|uniref:tetratricopeptide repeat protein n=1 Tax=Amycolatopsis sp. NBC_00355 TaxID=2975957 RepID=UPI002E257EBB